MTSKKVFLLLYQNRSQSNDICVVMTVQQGASGSLMEEEDWLLLIHKQWLTLFFLAFILLSKLCRCFQKSEVCPKTSYIFENWQEVPLGWEITWMNNMGYVPSPTPLILKASFSGCQAISYALWVSVTAIRYPDGCKKSQRGFFFLFLLG